MTSSDRRFFVTGRPIVSRQQRLDAKPSRPMAVDPGIFGNFVAVHACLPRKYGEACHSKVKEKLAVPILGKIL
ncbi:hypothetical protein [Bradyrhizobium sp. th.b2]|uniref:hypothetical protein n=1 Tax=Bradyrhizobium sp. th-b2 TaxID=172088 RepID=UPI0012EBF843|nr:hypothetical protein [Bradyrhizobium sp. th.b2]